jgi:hypothetical protein
MPAYPIVRFVGSIAASPTVDLDLNLGQPFTVRNDEFSLGAPAYAGDPMSKGVQWGYRTLNLVVQVSGTNAASLTALSALAKQVTVDNLLMVQLDASQPPVFFRTYKTQPSEIDMSNVMADSGLSYWRLAVPLTADAAAYGLLETGSQTINNDPAAGSNPCFYRFGTTVKGDLETPLYLEAAAADIRGRNLMASSQGLGVGLQTTPVLVQANSLTTGTASGAIAPVGSLTTNTGDAAMSGGNYTRYTGNASDDGANGPIGLMYGVNLLSSTPVGDYRILMRVRSGAAVDVWSFSIQQMSSATDSAIIRKGDVVPYTRDTVGPHWLDMGVFRVPFGSPRLPVGSPFGTAPTSPGITFMVTMDSNAVASKTVDFDCFLFIPVGVDNALATRYGTTAYDKYLPGSTYKTVLDGINDTRHLLDGSGNFSAGAPPAGEGGLPTLMPGADNTIHYLEHVGTGYNALGVGGTSGTNDDITHSNVVTWKYYPRYLHLRPAGT